MADDQTQPDPTPPQRIRRSSFAGQTFADLFGTGRSTANSSNPAAPTQQYPGPITTAAAQAQQRRMSLTTLGLSGANGQQSPFNSFRGRTESFGSANSGSIDESAVVEDDLGGGCGFRAEMGSSPITRRTSFGARALRDIRRGSMTGVPTQGGGSAGTSPGQQQSNEGFNWSDNFRTRAERTSSISAQGGGSGSPTSSSRMPAHARAKSVAVMEPPALEPPISSIPKPRDDFRRPDHFQERILKGDFYMD